MLGLANTKATGKNSCSFRSRLSGRTPAEPWLPADIAIIGRNGRVSIVFFPDRWKKLCGGRLRDRYRGFWGKIPDIYMADSRQINHKML